MSISAEALFNYLGQRYEDAFAASPNLVTTVKSVLPLLPPQSTVFDVGCGTGKPVSHMLAAAGHTVHGIDIAQKMVDIALRQVPGGRFERADMRTYNPPPPGMEQGHGHGRPFDAIFAIYSLFQISPGDTHAMVFRFAHWLAPTTGILVLGVTPSNSLPADARVVEDGAWEGCVRYMDKPWMSQTTDEVFLSEDAWRALLASAGFEIVSESFFTFRPEDQLHLTPEDHLLLVARRTMGEPFLGPYPYRNLASGKIEESSPGRTHLDPSAWKEFSRRVSSVSLETILSGLLGYGSVLEICSSFTAFAGKKGSNVHLNELSEGPFVADQTEHSNTKFESVIGTWILDHVEDVTETLHAMVRMVDRSARNPRIMLLQGAPWNEVIRFQNAVCRHLAGKSQRPSHQGYLLDTAVKVFASHGFGRVLLKQVNLACAFPEEDLVERCDRAADILVDLWFSDDPNKERMKAALVPQLRLHFRDKPSEIGFDMVMLVAVPDREAT
ncbi:S-adenosyl-L-methionine-dependent methyltransferase [Aspergillus pseudoustus]|uniref:S-adenosyl-L-methionine-dependent methyltransferase n=1 Tax=Aspergillus pseudoustus TaxID=1810923 RepID=A0ABR4IKL1_9EURO